jgi:hypothetical protein
MSHRALNVLQVCDHLGWEGSRMHGVKRLFGWMIPRFDARRFNVSLVSLRKKDLSEETLEAQGIDITYLHRGKFDPRTLADLLRVIDRKQIDVLHLHGYGATTFGRIAALMRRLPVIVHEHANLTDTPWFQKAADRLLEPATDIAIAVSKSTDGRAAMLKLPKRARSSVSDLTISSSARSPGCTNRKAIRSSSTRRRAWSWRARARAFVWSARDRCCRISKRRRRHSGSVRGLSLPDSDGTQRLRCQPSISACSRRSGRERR